MSRYLVTVGNLQMLKDTTILWISGWLPVEIVAINHYQVIDNTSSEGYTCQLI